MHYTNVKSTVTFNKHFLFEGNALHSLMPSLLAWR